MSTKYNVQLKLMGTELGKFLEKLLITYYFLKKINYITIYSMDTMDTWKNCGFTIPFWNFGLSAVSIANNVFGFAYLQCGWFKLKCG